MTREDKREKETRKASEKFVAFDLCGRQFTEELESFIEYCFGTGAQWADENPQSPWISVKEDLPCNHEELISSEDKRNTLNVIALVHRVVVSSRMEKFEGEWYWTTDEPTYWMPIPDLPKE